MTGRMDTPARIPSNHESTKGRKHERQGRSLQTDGSLTASPFVSSSSCVFVIPFLATAVGNPISLPKLRKIAAMSLGACVCLTASLGFAGAAALDGPTLAAWEKTGPAGAQWAAQSGAWVGSAPGDAWWRLAVGGPSRADGAVAVKLRVVRPAPAGGYYDGFHNYANKLDELVVEEQSGRKFRARWAAQNPAKARRSSSGPTTARTPPLPPAPSGSPEPKTGRA